MQKKTTGETSISSTTDRFVVYASNTKWRVLRFCLGTHGDSCPLNKATRCVIEMEYLRRRRVSQRESKDTSPLGGALINIYIYSDDPSILGVFINFSFLLASPYTASEQLQTCFL